MGQKKAAVAAAALQYSKWLSKFICYVWAIYRFAALFASVVSPDSATAIVSTVGTLDTIMIINEGTYLVNSLGEKYIYSDRFVISAFNKGWFKTIFKGITDKSADDGPIDNEEGGEEDGDDLCG